MDNLKFHSDPPDFRVDELWRVTDLVNWSGVPESSIRNAVKRGSIYVDDTRDGAGHYLIWLKRFIKWRDTEYGQGKGPKPKGFG